LGKLKDAIADYKAALKLDPKDVQAAQNLEFVKKRMEMKKEHPSKDGQQPPDDSGKKSKDGEKKPAEKEKKSEQGKQKSEESGQKAENRGQKSEDKGQQTKDNGQRAENKGQKEQKQPMAGGSEQNPKPESDQTKQAERILNRLQDMPGKALMPLYQPEHVDKDW
jgi:Ca-activated chloride channel family protein